MGRKRMKMMNMWASVEKPVRNEQRCCSAAEWLQEALQKSCKSTGLQQPQILAAVESPLTAINSALAAVQKIPELRSALQSGCKVASKRQRMLFGEQGWCSGESARLPPMCPGFDSRTRRHMWAEFVGSLLCSERFFSGNSGFPLSSKTNI